MRSFLLFVILLYCSHYSSACSENFLQPNFKILSKFRDDYKVEDMEKFLGQLRIGKRALSVNELVNQSTEISAREQILEFEKYIRKTIHNQKNNLNSIEPGNWNEKARASYSEYLDVLHSIYFDYKTTILKPRLVIEDLVPGEEFYYIFDSYKSDQVINLKFFSLESGYQAPYLFEPHLVSQGRGVIERFRQADMRFEIELVRKSGWKGERFKLYRFHLLEAN